MSLFPFVYKIPVPDALNWTFGDDWGLATELVEEAWVQFKDTYVYPDKGEPVVTDAGWDYIDDMAGTRYIASISLSGHSDINEAEFIVTIHDEWEGEPNVS